MSFKKASLHPTSHSFPVSDNLRRRRSDGILSDREVAWCHEMSIALAYDPAQTGWVPLACEDDIAISVTDGQGRGLRFRPWSVEDAPVLARMLSSERLWRYLPEGYPGRMDEQVARELIKLGNAPHHHVVAVVKDRGPIGQARLLFVKPDEAEISYWLGEDHWGKGLGSKIVRLFTEESLRERPKIRRIFARVHEDNVASRRVLEKASFVAGGREGVWEIYETFG